MVREIFQEKHSILTVSVLIKQNNSKRELVGVLIKQNNSNDDGMYKVD